VEYVDLYLMHWPQCVKDYEPNDGNAFPKDGKFVASTDYDFTDAWVEMEKIYASGRAKAIGVSNFSVKTLEKLLTTAKVVPAVNQVEIHPWLVQQDLMDYCNKKGIHVTAYTPTGRNFEGEPILKELAAKYSVSLVQVVFAWHMARGLSITTQSKNEERRKEALNLPVLDEQDVAKISALDKRQMAFSKPDEEGILYGWTLEQLGWDHLNLSGRGWF